MLHRGRNGQVSTGADIPFYFMNSNFIFLLDFPGVFILLLLFEVNIVLLLLVVVVAELEY